tara:strand:+ start:265 stop:495 length:231 start_codon:yes stop_codon:yes gene_type:complete
MRLFLTTFAIIAVSGSLALAVTADETNRLKVNRYSNGIDVSTLSNTHIAALLNVIRSGDHETEKQSTVASLVRQWR